MLQVLTISPRDRVLEVGTGSGYLTALLAELAAEVISVERHAVLAENARDVLARMGYRNVTVIVGDGSRGFPDAGPYDAVIVSAAAAEVPSALLEQMREDGRMIIPVGAPDSQQLQLIRMENGEPKTALRELCRFVPLVISDPI
jgi:protein-L-isoaspartate(D-aspartate) O-methyltransferase